MRLEKAAQGIHGSEMRGGPRSMSKPSPNASDGCPDAPAAKLADNKSPAWLQDTRHFGNCFVGLRHEAEQRYSHHTIKRGLGERKRLCLALQQAHSDRFRDRPAGRRFEHPGIGIKAGDMPAGTGKRDGKSAITASDVDHIPLIHVVNHFDKHARLEPIGDPSEPAAAPTRVGILERAGAGY